MRPAFIVSVRNELELDRGKPHADEIFGVHDGQPCSVALSAYACLTHLLHGTDEVTNKRKAEIGWH